MRANNNTYNDVGLRVYLISLAAWFGLDAALSAVTNTKILILIGAIHGISSIEARIAIVTAFGLVGLVAFLAAMRPTFWPRTIAQTLAIGLSAFWLILLVTYNLNNGGPSNDWPRVVVWAWTIYIQFSVLRWMEDRVPAREEVATLHAAADQLKEVVDQTRQEAP